MLSRLGYDPDAYPPTYGQADDLVANNTLLVRQNEEYYQRRAEDIQRVMKDMRSTTTPWRYDIKNTSENQLRRGMMRQAGDDGLAAKHL